MTYRTLAIKNWIDKNIDLFQDQSERDHMVDFLNNKYTHKKSINFSYKQAQEKVKKWEEELLNQNKNVLDQGLISVVMNLDDGYFVVKLKDQQSRIYEGYHMKHCVSTYLDHHELYSLRDSNNEPHCTVEVKDDKVHQIQGKANSKVKSKYIDYLLQFLKSQNWAIDNYNMNKIGYLNATSFGGEKLKNYFSPLKFVELNNNYYVYKLNELNLLRNINIKENPDLEQIVYKINCKPALEQVQEQKKEIEVSKENLMEMVFNYGTPYFLSLINKNMITVSPKDLSLLFLSSLIRYEEEVSLEMIRIYYEKYYNNKKEDLIETNLLAYMASISCADKKEVVESLLAKGNLKINRNTLFYKTLLKSNTWEGLHYQKVVFMNIVKTFSLKSEEIDKIIELAKKDNQELLTEMLVNYKQVMLSLNHI